LKTFVNRCNRLGRAFAAAAVPAFTLVICTVPSGIVTRWMAWVDPLLLAPDARVFELVAVVVAFALLIAAASLETWATPHRAPQAPSAESKAADSA